MATLAEKLQLTLDCKNEIKTVMNEKLGLEVTDSTPLSEYATKLKTVKVGSGGSGDSGSTKIPAFAMSCWATGTSGKGQKMIIGTDNDGFVSINYTGTTGVFYGDEKNLKIKVYYLPLDKENNVDNYIPFCGDGASASILTRQSSETTIADLTNSNEFILGGYNYHSFLAITLNSNNITNVQCTRVDLMCTSEDATVTIS